MDKEKAIELLDNLLGMIDDNQGNDYDSAIKKAINCLKVPNHNYDNCMNYTCKSICRKEGYKRGRADAIEKFSHALKETFNNEFPSNYHCTQPYFTLDNVRVLVDLVAKEQKNEQL